MKRISTKYICIGASISAIYVCLTLLLAPISYGPLQVRVSEALTLFPIISSAGIFGVTIGCLIANIYTGSIIDIIFGTLATLLAAILTRKLKKHIFLAPLPPVIINAVVVGFYLGIESGIKNMLFTMLSIFIGEFVSCYIIGLPIMLLIRKRTDFIEKLK